MPSLKIDKAIEKFAAMRETVHEHAYWTPRLLRTAAVYVVIIPCSIYWVCTKFDNVFDWRGKTNDMSLYRFPRLKYKDYIDQEDSPKSESSKN